MARPTYPSDEKRKRQRPHVKVHLSWPTHPRFAAVFADRDLRAVVVGIWMLAARAHVSATDDWLTLRMPAVMELTGCSHPPAAVQLLRRTAAAMAYELSSDCAGGGSTYRLHVRNFSRKQGFGSADGGATTHDSAPSEEPKNQGTNEPSKRRATPVNGGVENEARSARKRPKTDAPEQLSPEDHQHVREYFADVSPGYIALDLEPRIESALRYFHREGKRYVDWAAAVVDNIVALENRKRDRDGEPKLRTREQARELNRQLEAANQQELTT